MSGAPNFDDDHFDFPEHACCPSSTMDTALELLKSVILSRPFLLALIAFLSYRLWMAPSGKNFSVINTDVKRSSVIPDRVSVRKSQRLLPSVVPPVTAAKKN